MARIALVSFYNYPSLPVRQLHSILHEAGHEPVSVFFKRHRLDDMGPPTEGEYALLAKTIKEIDPLFVGLSLRSTYASVAKHAAALLHKDGHRLLWGGTHATMAPEDCVDHAEAVCVGEGEETLLDVAKRYEAGNNDLAGIANLWVKQGDEVIKTPQRPQIQNLDTLPLAWYEDKGCVYIEGNDVATSLPAGYMTSYDTMTSRGCAFRCEFCCHSVLVDTYRGLGRYNRRRSPELVIQELESALKRYPTVNRIRFWDDIFTATPKPWLREFSELYKARVGLPFWCYTTSDTAKPEVIKMLSDAGMRYIGMGIQSGSFRIRKDLYNRPETNEEILTANETFKQFDVHPEYDIICDNPFENEADYEEALELLLKLNAPYSLFQHHLTYFPNFPITRKAIEAGFIKPEDVEHISGAGYKTWHDEFSATRDTRYMFWITIYWLIQYPAIPRELIRSLAKNKFLRDHPYFFNQTVKPFARLGEKARWAYLYIKERGLVKTLWRYTMKRRQLQGDRTNEHLMAGAD